MIHDELLTKPQHQNSKSAPFFNAGNPISEDRFSRTILVKRFLSKNFYLPHRFALQSMTMTPTPQPLASQPSRPFGWALICMASFVVGSGTSLLAVWLMPSLFRSYAPKVSTPATISPPLVSMAPASTPVPHPTEIKVTCMMPEVPPISCPKAAPSKSPEIKRKAVQEKIYPPPPVRFIP